jgi:uncharacterized protein (DUF58 family)
MGTGLLVLLSVSVAWSLVRKFSTAPPAVEAVPAEHAIGHNQTVAVAVSVVPGNKASPRRVSHAAGVRTTVFLASGERSVVLTVSGMGSRTVRTNPVRRGVYTRNRTVVELFDPLGISKVVYTYPAATEEVLRVFPPEGPTIQVPPCPGRSGDLDTTGYGTIRNTEFIESRPYVPGDDPRRIRWSHYAHTGELFVRQGEEVPPPAGTCCIVLDAAAATSPEEVDVVTSIALRVARSVAAGASGTRDCRVVLGLLEGRTVWYDSVSAARWEWAGLTPSDVHGGDTEAAIVPDIDMCVTGGPSPRAPAGWSAGTFGLIFLDRRGAPSRGVPLPGVPLHEG